MEEAKKKETLGDAARDTARDLLAEMRKVLVRGTGESRDALLALATALPPVTELLVLEGGASKRAGAKGDATASLHDYGQGAGWIDGLVDAYLATPGNSDEEHALHDVLVLAGERLGFDSGEAVQRRGDKRSGT